MSTTNIVCPGCKKPIEISDAIQHQIDQELLKSKTEQSDMLRREYEVIAEEKITQAVQTALTEAQQASELQLARERQNARLELERAKKSTEMEAENLRSQVENERESQKQLREKQKALLEEVSKANKAKEEAELTARKELLEKEQSIRKEATERAYGDFSLKLREQEEINKSLRNQITDLKQTADLSSQQLQGEILELNVEEVLRKKFPFDDITEVKKGERGADIRQVVNDQFNRNCGLILWECKNAKNYQASWLGKLKDELAIEKAQIGVIVFNSADSSGDGYEQLSENIWLVRPRYVSMFATLLREVCVKLASSKRNSEGKDIKTEMLYNYLTGGEFYNRIRYFIEYYDEMTNQLELEKRQAKKRWAALEKILEKTTNNLYGMGGDLEGIIGQEIISLPSIDTEDEAPPTTVHQVISYQTKIDEYSGNEE